METALETFCKELERQMTIETFQFYKGLKEKCLELQRQQIIDAFDWGTIKFNSGLKAEQYFDENYGKD